MNTKFKHIQQEALEIFNSTPPNPTSMLDITDKQCKYWLGNENDRSELFCGKLCFKNYSYCVWHYIIAHDIKK